MSSCAVAESIDTDYKYIYCVNNFNNGKKLYFSDIDSIKFAFDCRHLNVVLERVENDSILYLNALNNSIKIKDYSDI